ncbi:hypothetical protein [Lonepinella sp. BR2271]|uniref:hypothetical protein n=1 Tax=Lonepinella sp. BR2271 TaxID=3434550 RepID=UPI003F6DD027
MPLPIAEYSNLSKGEKEMYDVSLKRKWDEYAVKQYWKKEGLQEGIQEGKLENMKSVTRNMLSLGLDVELISKAVGLSVEEIKKLQ